MSDETIPRLNKGPFLAGDALLIVAAAWLALRPAPELEFWRGALIFAAVAMGAWLAALPFLLEYRAAVRLAENASLASAVEQVKGLQAVGEQVTAATSRWTAAQEAADKTALTAKTIADQIAVEARGFAEAMSKAHDAEVRNLRLEVEKMRRGQGESLQAMVRMLDHVFALHDAAVKSGQAELIAQLGNFQTACRDAGRRVGLVAQDADPETPFDERIHETPPEMKPGPGARIVRTLAPGFTFQGQWIRRVLVEVAAG